MAFPDLKALSDETYIRGANQRQAELLVAGAAIRSTGPVNSVLEIGSAFGGSLWYWAQLAEPTARIMSIDVDHSQLSREHFEVGEYQRLLLHEARSDDPTSFFAAKGFFEGHETSSGVPALDFLFIDGDHSYDCLSHDFRVFSTLVRKGGWIGFHDVTGPMADVARFWREIRDQFPEHVEIQIEPVHHMGIGLLRV